MRSILASLCIPILLGGCAVQGTIVEKRSRQRPDSSMIGTEGVNSFVFRGPTGTSRPHITVPNPQSWAETGGSYKFMLRDRNGDVHSQLVTPEVFARYTVGDYFNDLLPPIEATDAKQGPTHSAANRRHSAHRQTRVAQKNQGHHRSTGRRHSCNATESEARRARPSIKMAKHHHPAKKHKATARRASTKGRHG